ncbi:hypothetical protein CLOM_g1697, partial [Closterium sp. NIES-68]
MATQPQERMEHSSRGVLHAATPLSEREIAALEPANPDMDDAHGDAAATERLVYDEE